MGRRGVKSTMEFTCSYVIQRGSERYSPRQRGICTALLREKLELQAQRYATWSPVTTIGVLSRQSWPEIPRLFTSWWTGDAGGQHEPPAPAKDVARNPKVERSARRWRIWPPNGRSVPVAAGGRPPPRAAPDCVIRHRRAHLPGMVLPLRRRQQPPAPAGGPRAAVPWRCIRPPPIRGSGGGMASASPGSGPAWSGFRWIPRARETTCPKGAAPAVRFKGSEPFAFGPRSLRPCGAGAPGRKRRDDGVHRDMATLRHNAAGRLRRGRNLRMRLRRNPAQHPRHPGNAACLVPGPRARWPAAP